MVILFLHPCAVFYMLPVCPVFFVKRLLAFIVKHIISPAPGSYRTTSSAIAFVALFRSYQELSIGFLRKFSRIAPNRSDSPCILPQLKHFLAFVLPIFEVCWFSFPDSDFELMLPLMTSYFCVRSHVGNLVTISIRFLVCLVC